MLNKSVKCRGIGKDSWWDTQCCINVPQHGIKILIREPERKGSRKTNPKREWEGEVKRAKGHISWHGPSGRQLPKPSLSVHGSTLTTPPTYTHTHTVNLLSCLVFHHCHLPPSLSPSSFTALSSNFPFTVTSSPWFPFFSGLCWYIFLLKQKISQTNSTIVVLRIYLNDSNVML